MALNLRYFIIFLLIVSSSLVFSKKRTLGKSFECVSGTRYQENKCNICECKNGELVGCSRTNCDNLPFYDVAKNCTVGKRWLEECNKCYCTRQYGTVCDMKICPEARSKHQAKRGRTQGKRRPIGRASILNPPPKVRTQRIRMNKGRATIVRPLI